MSKANGYSHASHTSRVLKSSGVRIGARLVLQHLCSRAEFDKPEVTITKPQIERDLGLERKAVQRALAHLRAKGIIVATKGFEGGRGVAVTYKLVDIGPDAALPRPMGVKAAQSAIAARRVAIMAEHKGMTWGEAQNHAKEQIAAEAKGKIAAE